MKYTPNAVPSLVGTLTVGPGDSLQAIKDRFIIERAKAHDHCEVCQFRQHARAKHYGTVTLFNTYPTRRENKHVTPKPGNGVVKHNPTVERAIKICKEQGLEFWSLGAHNQVWGVRDGIYYRVGRGYKFPVNAKGLEMGA